MALPVLKPGNNFTYSDYTNWPDDERWELIDGYAYNMSPSPSRRHQNSSPELSAKVPQVTANLSITGCHPIILTVCPDCRSNCMHSLQ